MRTLIARAAGVAAALLPLTAPLAAQRPTPLPPPSDSAPRAVTTSPVRTCGSAGLPDCPPGRFGLGAALEIAQPLDEFRDFVDVSVGANFSGRVLVAPGSPLGLLVNGGFISYGSEREDILISNGFYNFPGRLQTSSTYGHFGVGPELALRTGAVRPYVGGTVGLGHFGTRSSINARTNDPNDSDGWEEVWSESLQGDAVLALTGLGGLRIALGGLRAPLTLDVGVRYVHNGEAEYVAERDIDIDDNANVTVTPTRSRADFVSYSIGVSYLFGRGR